MDRTQLLQHFDTLVETPEAAAKLRNLVLSLAVRGQLLLQNAEDDKHAKWKEFAAKFARPETENGDEPPFLVPKSWRWTRLNDVADYAAADKVDPSEIKDADWVLDLEEIEKDTSRIVRIARFAEKQSSSTKAKFLPGDVLYGKLRPYLNKVIVAPRVGFCTTEIVPIRSRGIIEPAYLCVFLRSPDFVGSDILTYPGISANISCTTTSGSGIDDQWFTDFTPSRWYQDYSWAITGARWRSGCLRLRQLQKLRHENAAFGNR